MAAASAEVSADGDHAVLRNDDRGIPRCLPLLAALVEANALRNAAAAASRPAESDLARAFRGGARPAVQIGEFLERIHTFIQLQSVRHVIQLRARCYVLAGIYLTRFMRSAAAREGGLLVDPSTAHRLVAVALFLGAKFGGPDDRLPMKWTPVFETSSDGAIRAKEMADLERRFLRAVDYRLFVKDEEFEWFCGILETAPTSVGCSCGKGGRKRTAAESVEGEEQDERRRVRACVPPPAVVAN
ncbi:cyclin-P4-1-like [Oryza brachyantha]|uniref:cyclin-P4-1-like n=1 Tax=Oryza brachyantha TaxID=4533 RepID=UPI0003EABF34|nr:cyclin-P4-1-like [Oryza brachyantha]